MVDEDFAWRLAQGLVKIDSSDPGAYEGEIEQHIKGLVEAYIAKLDSPVLNAAEIRELEVLPGRRNLMVTVPGMSDKPRLVYICHMDTVTLGDGWDADTTVGFFTGYTDTAVIAGKTGNRNLDELRSWLVGARAQAQRVCAPCRYRSLPERAHRACRQHALGRERSSWA